ncbi:efflux RND transporter permease subunit [Paenibacillus sp. BSR1-1]|uniref:efflux RND transporter permease subunit n=1 Tax=Paenibacillus sp. BSR1-1 TaxID=3020845 RepID=UPI0025B11D1A|nr:efflux RND transporter permease subunit [Paenibacillus sp. BSR1-1]MDN3015974.1 efflux RND transporter permease subunit [Paenibacillus sp. BSR1-1]
MKPLINEMMERGILILTLIVLILVWGGMSAWQIQRDYLPEINNSTLSVTVRADNYQADQVKAIITEPIQQAVRVVDGLQDVETNYFNGGSLISLNFPMNFNMEQAEEQVTKVLADVKLPAGIDKPLVTRLSTHSMPIIRMSLMSSSENISENMLRSSIQEDFVNRLKTVPGVKDVRVSGGGTAGYAVSLRLEDLTKAGLTVNDVKQSLEKNYRTGLEGKVSNNQVSIPVQVSGWGLTQQDLLKLPIHNGEGKTVPLSDVAGISNSIVNLETISRTDGKPSVLLDVLKTSTSNITDVSDRIKSKIKDIPALKNKDIQASILFDQGAQVNDSLKGLIKEGLLGCLFSMICVFLFFRKVRSTLLIVLSLPICLLATTGLLKTMGISLNILTVSGLIVAMGRVVDDSIVILDNMNRKVHEANVKTSVHTLTQAVREMIPAIVSSTSTTVAVYVPIALIGGMVSSAFSGFAWSVVIALIISLFVSILVVPALYNLFWKGKPVSGVDKLESFAHKILTWVFDRKKKVVLTFVSLFLLTSLGAAFLPVNFLPTAKTGQIAVQIEMPQNTSLADVDAEVKRLEALLGTNVKVESFSSGLGSSFTPQSDDVFDAGGGWLQKPNIANLSIKVKNGTDVNDFIKSLQNQLNSLSSKAVYAVSNQNIAGDDSQLKINLTGSDSQTLETMAQTIRNELKLIPGLSVQGAAEADDHMTQYQITLNRKAIEHFGIKLEDVINRIQQYTAEGTKGFISINQNQFPIVIHTDKQNGTSKDIFTLMGGETFQDKDGKSVRLDQLATLEPTGSSVIQDKDGHPYAVITTNIISSDIGKVSTQVKTALGKIPLPEGIEYSFVGAPQQVYEMIYEMALALFFSILLVLIIISSVFRGWRAPMTVLICIPLAFIGSVIGMFIFKLEWNLAALVGLLMLTGIVVTNGIVLVDKIERNLRDGFEPKLAIMSGTSTRVRPVLMTACTTVLTLLPLAVSGKADTIVSQTLGVVVVGGMISSTLICLLVIPIMYEWMSGRGRKTKTSQQSKISA